MAGSSLLTLIDDIASLLDDVAALTKVATQKTAGVLGDDLALNAHQVAGVTPDRELPVVWAVAKGSARNKLILVPAALAIGALAPWAVTPLLMIGGGYLCYEGVEKLAHRLLPHADDDAPSHVVDAPIDLVAFERDKIAGAVRTDFVLSAEIVAITLGTVAESRFPTQVLVLSGVAVLMTVGVYGLVAGIVKLDDVGLHLRERPGDHASVRALRRLGDLLIATTPTLMRGLSVVGTIAMFLVGGGILTHGVPALHHGIEGLVAGLGGALAGLVSAVLDAAVGVVAGTGILLVVLGIGRARRALRRG